MRRTIALSTVLKFACRPSSGPNLTQPKRITPANAYTNISKNIPRIIKNDLKNDTIIVNISILSVA
jgi:hypothetical protein